MNQLVTSAFLKINVKKTDKGETGWKHHKTLAFKFVLPLSA